MTTANPHAANAGTSRSANKVDPETVTISGYVVGERYGPDTVLTHDPADPSSFPGACPWDIAPFGARDGQVNGADLGLVLSAWGLPGITDFNGDGVTNGADLAQVLANWGACP